MLKKPKEYIMMDKETGQVVHEGTDRRLTASKVMSFLGFTPQDAVKMLFYFSVAIVFGTKFWMQSEDMKTFIGTQTAINAHLALCNDNRDKWATAQYGHSFTCGKPDDGWAPNMGNLKP